MTIKPPEEGIIWEWRAFGRLDPKLESKIRALPIRNGLVDHADEDVYLVSPASDQNVKLRKLGESWVLKFKELIEKGADCIELYREGQDTVFGFPVTRGAIETAAALLNTKLPGQLSSTDRFSREELVNVLAVSSPEIRSLDVPKVRSQFLIDGGWVELAEAIFPRGNIQTLSVHSFQRAIVEQNLEFLEPGGQLSVMNYIDACRKWG
jgi:hypothetical protein